MLDMNERRNTTLQQPSITRSFVNIPANFIKKLHWTKGECIVIELKEDKIIIFKSEK